jgi:ankyrin repeat protein
MNNITSAPSIKRCEHFAEYYEEAAAVLSKITSKLTPEEFDALCASNINYKLNHSSTCNHGVKTRCWTALDLASVENNIPLIQHIVKKGGNDLLNLGDDDGKTPLLTSLSIYNFTELDTSPSIKELIRLNADVNMLSKFYLAPLWLAATAHKGLEVVKLLLKCGAIVDSDLGEIKEIGEARKEIKEEIRKNTVEQCSELALICKNQYNPPKDILNKMFELLKLVNEAKTR